MKLIRFGNEGEEKPGLLLEDGRRIDASGFGQDWNEDFFSGDAVQELSAWLEDNADSAPSIAEDTRWAPAVSRPGKIICIGLNYKDHAEESGMEAPKEPVVFFKATSSICGPFDPVKIPRNAEKVDWEVELAIVIGKRANYVSEDEALNHVAGYMLHNDYSERSFQLDRGGQWVKGKSCDTFAPLGPFVATSDEIADPNKLNLWLKVNEEQVQNGNTENFIFNVQHVVSYLSQFMSLMPGDIISTGTPAGVGLGMKPPRYLKAGDVVELGIEGLGSSKQTVIE